MVDFKFQHSRMHTMFHIQHEMMSILYDTDLCVSWRLKACIFNGQCVLSAIAERSGARDYKHPTQHTHTSVFHSGFHHHWRHVHLNHACG